MKKLLVFLLLVLIAQNGFSQVGINTTSPNAQLDIRSSNQVTPSNTDGILIPKIDAFPITNPTATQTGMMVYLTTTSAGKSPGFYYWNNSTASWLPVSKTDDDWYEVGSTNPPNAITDDMFHTGNVAIGKTSATSKLDVEQTTSNIYAVKFKHSNPMNGLNSTVVNNEIVSNQADGIIVGVNNVVEANNVVQGYGTYNNVQGNSIDRMVGTANVFPSSSSSLRIGTSTSFTAGTGQRMGAYNGFSGSGGMEYGVFNSFLGTPTQTTYGMYNAMNSVTASEKKGVYNTFGNIGVNPGLYGDNYGMHNFFDGLGDVNNFGVRNQFGGTQGVFYGDYNTLTDYGTADLYSSHSIIDGNGTGDKIGTSVVIYPSAGGNHYGIRSIVTKPTGFAGYFLGRVSVGDTDANKYILPLTKGTNGQIMQTDGAGNVSWQNPNTIIGNNFWSTTGNSGTNFNSNFIGTTDAVPLVFKINNQFSGKIESTTDGRNTFFGYQSGMSNNSSSLLGGKSNSAFGCLALTNNSVGNSNTAMGYNALFSNTTGNSNVAVGSSALLNNSSGADNIAVGSATLFSNTFGNFNIGIGNGALRTNTTGSNNLALGNGALYSSSTPSFNVALGNNALYYNSTGANNLAIGVQALYSNLTSSNNIAIGNSVLYANTIGARNIGIGAQSLTDNISGNYNIALGNSTLKDNTSGDENVAIGDFTLQLNTTGDNNTSVGTRSLFYNTTGYANTALGFNALFANTTGSGNIGIGFSSVSYNSSGIRNIGIGGSSLFRNDTGNYNIGIGPDTLHENIVGSNNVAIGYQAGYNELGSNKLYIENSNSATPLIYGEFDTDILRANSQRFFVNDPTVNGIQMMLKNSNLYQHAIDANLNFGTGGGYFLMATAEAQNETAGIRGDGNNVSIWSPGDGGRQLRILDEDSWFDNNGNPYDNAAEVAYIANNGQYFQVSDRNKKENIQKIQNATSKITQISGYTYQFKLKPTEVEKGEKPTVSSGVLAQEIETVLPEAIQINEYGEYFVDYAAITPLLIEAIKEQNTKIQLLEQRLQQLEEKVSK